MVNTWRYLKPASLLSWALGWQKATRLGVRPRTRLLVWIAAATFEAIFIYWLLQDPPSSYAVLALATDLVLFVPFFFAISVVPEAGIVAVCAAAVVAIPLELPSQRPEAEIIIIFWVPFVAIVAVTIIQWRHSFYESQDTQDRLVRALLKAEADERKRIATELHDDTVQCMTAALMQVEVARRNAISQKTIPHLDKASDILRESLERTRKLMFETTPRLLEKEGLNGALGEVARQAAKEMPAAADIEIVDERFEPTIELMMFRSMREAILNARNHSKASRVKVTLQHNNNHLIGVVTDNGKGFAYPSKTTGEEIFPGHVGLHTMDERMALLGGNLEVLTAPGVGTTLKFTAPLYRGWRSSV